MRSRAALAALSVATFLASAPARSGADAPVSCPKTLAQWKRWKQTVVSDLAIPASLANGRLKPLTECQSQPEQKAFFEDPGFRACMSPLQATASMVEYADLHQLENSLEFIGNAPRAEAGPDDIEGIEELPPFFHGKEWKAAVEARHSPKADFDKMIARIPELVPGASVIQFESRFGMGDMTYVVRVPGEKAEKWVHITLNNSSVDDLIFQVAVEKQDRRGKRLDPPRAFFGMYVAHSKLLEDVAAGSGKAGNPPISGHERMMGITNLGQLKIPKGAAAPIRVAMPAMACLTCHKTGAIPIVPGAGYEPVSHTPGIPAAKVIGSMNAAIAANANAQAVVKTLPNLGPAMGPVNPPSRTLEFVRACSRPARHPVDSLKRIQKGMNCASCHDHGAPAGILNYPMGMGGGVEFTADATLKGMIHSGHMPPGGEKLSPEERESVHRCLVAEYYGGFKSAMFPNAPKTPGIFLTHAIGPECPDSVPSAQSRADGPGKPLKTEAPAAGHDPSPPTAGPAR